MPSSREDMSPETRPLQRRRERHQLGLAVCLLGLVATEAWVGVSRTQRPKTTGIALRAELSTVSPGDRFVGWIRHPVLTSRQKFDLVVEVGPGEEEGAWKIIDPNKRLKARKSYEGPCKVIRYDDGGIAFRDLDTLLNGTLNGAGPGTISGRTVQGGLKWGGFFEVKLEE
mmetsp:Transcript_47032/g.102388  ORF Transcript_47032/g.102388 Transcript_47032/m.102388 type:complete len:170 (-) Transcript_47032:98-607(-)